MEIGVSVPKKYARAALPIIKEEFLSSGESLKADLRCDVEMSECWAGTKQGLS